MLKFITTVDGDFQLNISKKCTFSTMNADSNCNVCSYITRPMMPECEKTWLEWIVVKILESYSIKIVKVLKSKSETK